MLLVNNHYYNHGERKKKTAYDLLSMYIHYKIYSDLGQIGIHAYKIITHIKIKID